MSVPANGRAATRPEREAPTQRDTGRVVASLERIAGLHHDLAGAYRDLSREYDIQLADLGRQSDLSVVPNPTPGPAELLTADDVAARLQTTAKTVRRWEREGRIPKARRLCGMVRWAPEAIDAWIARETGR